LAKFENINIDDEVIIRKNDIHKPWDRMSVVARIAKVTDMTTKAIKVEGRWFFKSNGSKFPRPDNWYVMPKTPETLKHMETTQRKVAEHRKQETHA
jgi:hypothetical protein